MFRWRMREIGWGWVPGGLWLAVLLIGVAVDTASAEWVRAGGTHKYNGYVDMATIGSSDHTVTLWTLRDFKVVRQVAKGPYRSMKTKKQFDCLAQRSGSCS
ncbi:MAG: hypothetical protein U0412_10995 [Nitrospira sp.]